MGRPNTQRGGDAAAGERVWELSHPRAHETPDMSEEWTPLKISALIALWNEGLSTSEIGNRLGVTKNAVVGKVHRLGLPKRNSPIPKRPEPAKVLRFENLAPGQCAWPEGEPGTDAFQLCGEPIVEGRPYCASHCERAYVRVVKERKDTEAA